MGQLLDTIQDAVKYKNDVLLDSLGGETVDEGELDSNSICLDDLPPLEVAKILSDHVEIEKRLAEDGE